MPHSFLILLAGATVVVAEALTVDRFGAVDEIGLFNPVYTWLTSGRMTYPVHYYLNEMIVHPPVHYLQIGMWMKAGLPLYYAEAFPTIPMQVIALTAIARASFPSPVRAGLVVGCLRRSIPFGKCVWQVE